MKTQNPPAAFFFLIALSLLFYSPLTAQSIIRIEEQVIPTYPFSDPNPVPMLVHRPVIYPYFAFNTFTTEPTPAVWKVVTLENEYVRVFVLPEIGGKVLGAVEKSTGHEFLYHNKVLKFRQIAMRGPWTSGGIEFNFGLIGHTPSVATPTDYLIRKNNNGSVSCFVGAMDLTSRTRWTVEIMLPPDRAWFRTRTFWSNPSPLHQSYYAWTNNAVQARMDLQYFYPGTMKRPHGYGRPMDPWPKDEEGRDLSWYRNHTFGADHAHFVMGTFTDYFGGYWHDLKFGFGHWARYDDMPGKKMWIWALSRQGAIWEDLLTDADGQYSEPQAGRLLSQDDHAFFEPYTTDIWEETFFPFKETGGISAASPEGVMHVKQEPPGFTVSLCALACIADELVVTAGGDTLLSEPVTLNPMETRTVTLTLPDTSAIITASLGSTLHYTSDPSANLIGRPLSYDRIDERTTEGLFLAGEFYQKRRRYHEAGARYTACLEKEPQHLGALVRLAELRIRQMDYNAGLQLAGRALTLDKYDADANYMYAIAARKLGRLTDTKETLGWAARSMKYRSCAYCQLAEIAILEHNLNQAAGYVDRALAFNTMNIRARGVSAVLNRLQGKPEEASACLDRLEDADPLNHLIRFERYRLQPSDSTRSAFVEMIRHELPHESFLELSAFYASIGRDTDLLELLALAPETPITLLWRAFYLRRACPAESKSLLEQALASGPRLVFPFREESLPVLEWAATEAPGSWKPKYYLGLLLWHHGRTEDARDLLSACGQCRFAPYYIVMAHLFPEKAAFHYREAWKIDPADWRTWHFLIRHTGKTDPRKALKTAERAVKRFPGNGVLTMDLASMHYANRNYESCLSRLENTSFLPYEGGWEAHHLYMSAHIQAAMERMDRGAYRQALESLEASGLYPEHLGTGEPYDADRRIQDYLASLCYRRLGDTEKARETEKRVLEYTLTYWKDAKRNDFFGYQVLLRSGMQAKAEALRTAWSQSGNALNQWYEALLASDEAKARKLEQTLKANPRYEILCSAVRFAFKFERKRGKP